MLAPVLINYLSAIFSGSSIYKGKNFKIIDNDRKNIFLFLLLSSFFFTNESFIINASFHLIVRLSEKVFSRPKENLTKNVSIKKIQNMFLSTDFVKIWLRLFQLVLKLVSDDYFNSCLCTATIKIQ